MNILEIRNKALYLFSRKVLNELYSLQNAIVKGVPLSIMCYKNLSERLTADIDILIPRQILSKAEAILIQNGFMQKGQTAIEKRKNQIFCLSSSHQILPYSKQLDNYSITIDLNFDLFWGEYKGKRIDVADFLSDTIDMDIYGCKVKTFPPIKTLIQLTLHHYKDLNSIFLLATRPIIKQDMFKDVYYLLKNNLAEIPLDKLYNMSAEYDIVPYVYYVLYYTGQLYEDRILTKYIEAFKTPEGERLLNSYGLNDSERKEWRVNFQTRLESKNIYSLIENDLTERDCEKITINRRVFLGE